MPADDYDHLVQENHRLQEAITECNQLSLAMAGRFAKQHHDLLETHLRLRKFVDWVLDEMKDGGDLDGGSFQDNAQRLGILVETRPTEPCSDTCVCSEYYSAEEFTHGEARCFVRSTLVGGKVPPPPFTCPTCQGGGLAITTDQGAGCPACGKVG